MINMEQQLTLKLFHTVLAKEVIVTLVYVKSDVVERIKLWDSLYNLAQDMQSPWLVRGDFNIIVSEEEKHGGMLVYIQEVEDFAHCIDTCNLFYLGYKGSLYTWWNGRSGDACIFKSLDRYLGNLKFQELFPALEVEHFIKYGSDHAPLLRTCNVNTVQVKKSLKFLNFWAKSATFKDVIKKHWQSDVEGNPFMIFYHKLSNVKKALVGWNKETFGDIFKQIDTLEDVIKVHEIEFKLNPTPQNMAKLHKVEADITRCLHLDEEFSRQKEACNGFGIEIEIQNSFMLRSKEE